MYSWTLTSMRTFAKIILAPHCIGRCFGGLFLGLFVALSAAESVYAQSRDSACGSLTNAYGPYDYRTDHDKLPIVLGAHFTAEVEALIRGRTSTRPGGDIDYTLRAIPNNHRALIAMMRLAEKEKTPRPSGASYSIECYFDRALLFRPDDVVVRMIYSTYLNSKARIQEANTQLELATAYAKDNAFTHYNIGLHYFDLKNYEKALIQAHQAISLGFSQTALRDQLQSVGKWTEPTNPLSVPSAAASAPAEQAK
ncbi:MAG TPA: ABC transporter permease [Burkholderiaceae bacterium]|nr:ABC transporter permease [Burkholderiaceae bacterium]HPW06654.1 ABC transporter permease [Burkholderiaceae bacterium]